MSYCAELQRPLRGLRPVGSGLAKARATVAGAVRLVSARLRRYRQARAACEDLRPVDDRMLRDLGLDRPRLSDDFCMVRWLHDERVSLMQ